MFGINGGEEVRRRAVVLVEEETASVIGQEVLLRHSIPDLEVAVRFAVPTCPSYS